MLWIGLIMLVVCQSGCATWKKIKVEKPSWKSGDFRAELPVNWYKGPNPNTFLFLIYDGARLQSISLSKTKTDKELPVTKKKIIEDMLLHEVAGIIVDELSLDKNINNFVLIENKPSKLKGAEAFKLMYEFTNSDTLKYRSVLYGFIYKKRYYEIQYTATTQHNFDKFYPDFEKFVSSFEIIHK